MERSGRGGSCVGEDARPRSNHGCVRLSTTARVCLAPRICGSSWIATRSGGSTAGPSAGTRVLLVLGHQQRLPPTAGLIWPGTSGDCATPCAGSLTRPSKRTANRPWRAGGWYGQLSRRRAAPARPQRRRTDPETELCWTLSAYLRPKAFAAPVGRCTDGTQPSESARDAASAAAPQTSTRHWRFR